MGPIAQSKDQLVADSIDPAAKLKTGDARDNKLGTVIGQVHHQVAFFGYSFRGDFVCEKSSDVIPDLYPKESNVFARSGFEYLVWSGNKNVML